MTLRFDSCSRGLALVVLATLLAGCSGHPIQRKLEGRWIGQEVENVREDLLAQATGWAKGASFEFSGSSVTVAITGEDPRSGEYQVTRVNRGTVDLRVKDRAGKVYPLALRLDDEHSMRWLLGGGRSIVLRREG